MNTRLPLDHREAVVYQIYPRSFCDSNGDGIGDLPGLSSRLDHLQALGVNVVWLSPVYASPQDDNGYDISDYRAIAPEFGTLADFDEMLAQMHARGIRLVMDLVVNHSSDAHHWFEAARRSRDDPFHDFYIWQPPRRGPLGERMPPTNWEAAFQGSAWEWNEATGEYYLHMFSPRQPDLNWENPRVRAEVYDIMRFWLDRGVDGFRMDVINMVSKPWQADGRLPDAAVVRPGFLQPAFAQSCNGPRLSEFLTEMRREVLDRYPGCLTVGEAPLATVAQGCALTHPRQGALNMLFHFEHMDLDSVGGHVQGKWVGQALALPRLKACMARWQDALHGQGWNSLYLSNHDQPRQVSRFGDDGHWRELSAKMLATWLHGHQGTPYVYQGEELGMANVAFERIEDYRDIESLNFYRVATSEWGWSPAQALEAVHRKGRDNARTPMPWSDGPSCGFSAGRPWIALAPQAPAWRADLARADAGSVFHHYRRLIALRRQVPALVNGRHRGWLPEHPCLDAYTRTCDAPAGAESPQTLLVLCNFSAQLQTLPEELAPLLARAAQLLLGNYPDAGESPRPLALTGLVLRPYEALICQLGA